MRACLFMMRSSGRMPGNVSVGVFTAVFGVTSTGTGGSEAHPAPARTKNEITKNQRACIAIVNTLTNFKLCFERRDLRLLLLQCVHRREQHRGQRKNENEEQRHEL